MIGYAVRVVINGLVHAAETVEGRFTVAIYNASARDDYGTLACENIFLIRGTTTTEAPVTCLACLARLS